MQIRDMSGNTDSKSGYREVEFWPGDRTPRFRCFPTSLLKNTHAQLSLCLMKTQAMKTYSSIHSLTTELDTGNG